MYEQDCSYDGFKWIVVDDNTQNIASFVRYDAKGNYTLAVFNFSPVTREKYLMGVPEAREYKCALSSGDAAYGGPGVPQTVVKASDTPMHSYPYSVSLTIPGNSATYFVGGKKLNLKSAKTKKIDKDGETK